jgi:dihydrolipoamide dehydrogenase
MYDLAIIGGGPAGYNGALKAAELGLNTVLIEKAEIGGTCLNRGCIPTKSLLKSAEVYHEAINSEIFGVSSENVVMNYQTMYQKKNDVVKKLRNGIEFLIKKSKLEYISGEARFLDKNTIKVNEQIIEAKDIVIACGSKPASLPIKGGEFALNSDDVLSSPVEGNEIIIIGGGVIGTEYASLFSYLGKNVTIIEYANRILPIMDIDASNTISMALKKRGVKIFTNSKVEEIRKDDKYSVIASVKDEEKEFSCDQVIVSIGRVANIGSLDLDNAGVKYDRKIIVDDNFRTNIPNIYSVGDASSKIQLAHYAEAEALCVIDIIAGVKPSIDLSVVPSAVYTCPELAMVGRIDAMENEVLYMGKAFMMANGKANIENVTTGFVKTVFNSDGIIIGGVIINSRATDLIGELTLAIANRLTVSDIIKTIHPHPTLSEAIKESAKDAYKKIINN